MEMTANRYKGGGSLHRLLSTRRGTALVAGVCTVVAATILVVALSSYRSSVEATTQPETVLVASALIQKGTPGSVASSQGMLRPERIVAKQVTSGAIADASAIQGKVASTDIQPGQQLTVTDFAGGAGILSQLAPNERAISIPVDSAHGMIGVLRPGDRVDVYAGLNTSAGNSASAGVAVKLLLKNVQVLSIQSNSGAGLGGASTGTTNVVLKVNANDAGALAFASDNGKLWLDLRGANATGPNAQSQATYTATSLLLGSASGSAGTGGNR